ncbi:MAG: hypothetical protein RIA63_05720 [Cyclobacteriaceae bacterium]
MTQQRVRLSERERRVCIFSALERESLRGVPARSRFSQGSTFIILSPRGLSAYWRREGMMRNSIEIFTLNNTNGDSSPCVTSSHGGFRQTEDRQNDDKDSNRLASTPTRTN